MKLATLLKTKQAYTIISGGIVLLGLAGGGVYLAENKSKQMTETPSQSQTQTNSNTNSNSNDVDSNPTADGKTTEPTTNTNTQATTPTTTANLNDVTIQGTLDAGNNVLTSLYGSPGVYTIEKETTLNSGTWTTVLASANYVGSGGLDLSDPIPVGVLSRKYRVYKIVNGQKIGPKEILIDYNVVKSSGGASFPEAQ